MLKELNCEKADSKRKLTLIEDQDRINESLKHANDENYKEIRGQRTEIATLTVQLELITNEYHAYKTAVEESGDELIVIRAKLAEAEAYIAEIEY